MKRQFIAMSATALLLSAAAALAHHSGAMFDRSKTIVLKGTLVEYKFVAPHSWISLEAVANGKGPQERWDIEGATASRMKAQGITPERLKPGDEITIRTHPLRDGRKGGSLVQITLADGTTMINNTTKLQVGE
jgi:hypothetical protein